MQLGWLCPRCGKINNPILQQCLCEPEETPEEVEDINAWLSLEYTDWASSTAINDVLYHIT